MDGNQDDPDGWAVAEKLYGGPPSGNRRRYMTFHGGHACA